MKRYLCDKCKCIIEEGEETTVDIRGVQNFTVHMCFNCLSEMKFFEGQ